MQQTKKAGGMHMVDVLPKVYMCTLQGKIGSRISGKIYGVWVI
jgi:hypothetical protein